jgi:hypothetical protein
MFELLTVRLLPHWYSSQERGRDESDVNLTMFDSEDDESSDPNDCYHHIEKVSTSIQMFIIFITSLIITN